MRAMTETGNPQDIDVASWFRPQWPYRAGLGALTTSRVGNAGRGQFAGFNLGAHVGDDADSVAANRQRLLDLCADQGLNRIQWLDQVHGTAVVRADGRSAAKVPTADAAWTDEPGLGLAIMTADCLPVVIVSRDGDRVGIAHGGWRGLVAGVLGRLLGELGPAQNGYAAWIGPGIGVAAYEVGAEVADQVRDTVPAMNREAPVLRPGKAPGKYQLDLAELARRQLMELDVDEVYLSGVCTFADRRCYSYRRDGITGRMVTLVWIAPAEGVSG